jgi:hypothetical protein
MSARRNARHLTIPSISNTLGRMLAKVYSCAVIGLDGAIVEVEVDTANGLPSFVVAGAKSQSRSPADGKAGEAD